VFPVRYELDSYIVFRRNSVFKGLILGPAKGDDDAEIGRQNRRADGA
jgi:hypothetical protein